MSPKRWLWIGGAGVLVLALAVSLLLRGGGLGVQASRVVREDIQAKVSANGRIQAVTKADISANVMGQVTRLAVGEGDVVKKGQFLMEIDPRSAHAGSQAMEASLKAAQSDQASAVASLAQATSDLARGQANVRAGIISAAEFERLRTARETARATEESARRRVEQARATLAQSHVGLAYTTITAPMDGVVTARRIEQGETAVPGLQNQPGTVLLTISDMSRIEAEMEVDEASIPSVKPGQKAQVRIDAYPNQFFDAVVTEVGGSPLLKTSNEATKFKVKVQILNPPLTIKPGLSSQADIFTGRRDQVLALPIQALVMREKKGAKREEEGVFLIKGGKAFFQAVTTGLMGELDVEVTSGLQGGEQVITGPFKVLRDLKDGDVVKVLKAPDKKVRATE